MLCLAGGPGSRSRAPTAGSEEAEDIGNAHNERLGLSERVVKRQLLEAIGPDIIATESERAALRARRSP